jgi:hypothetical protein
VEDGGLKLEYCPTEDIVADGLTKALAPERHMRLTRMMGMARMGAWQKLEEKDGESGSGPKVAKV